MYARTAYYAIPRDERPILMRLREISQKSKRASVLLTEVRQPGREQRQRYEGRGGCIANKWGVGLWWLP